MTTASQLSFLIGEFAGVEEMQASTWAPAGSATSTSTAAPALGGSVVLQSYIQQRSSAMSFAIEAVWMTDPATGEILYYGFDTAGFPPDPPARGTWHGTDLRLDRTTPRGSSRLSITPMERGWAWRESFRASGELEWILMQEASFKPVEPAGRL